MEECACSCENCGECKPDKKTLKAVILVGGQGTRLRPLTYNTPKPMVPVLNLPFLEHVIRNLKEHNVTEIVMAQHYLPAQMKDYFGNGSKLGVKLYYVMEDSPLGTAGAIKNVEGFLTGTFFVLNGDIFHNRDFTALLKYHRRHRAKATLVLSPVEDPTAYGLVETDKRGRVTRFLEKPKLEDVTTNMINAGTYVLEPEVLKRIPAETKFSFERDVFPQMVAEGIPVYAYPTDNYWMDTGTPEKYLQLHRDLLGGKCDGWTVEKDVTTGEGCKISASAKFNGTVVIGDKSDVAAGVKFTGPVGLGHNCKIGGKSKVSDSVVWNNTVVGKNTTIEGSILANDCIIGDGCTLVDVVLGDHVTVKDGVTLPKSARIQPNETVKE
jgi:mannose-1-phosphate guanylyltransferase